MTIVTKNDDCDRSDNCDRNIPLSILWTLFLISKVHTVCNDLFSIVRIRPSPTCKELLHMCVKLVSLKTSHFLQKYSLESTNTITVETYGHDLTSFINNTCNNSLLSHVAQQQFLVFEAAAIKYYYYRLFIGFEILR